MLHYDSTEFRAIVTLLCDASIAARHGGADLATVEDSVAEGLSAIGREVMTRVLSTLGETEAFEEDGIRWKPAVVSPLEAVTLFGTVKVERTLFRSTRNGPTRCLVSERAGLLGRWTPKAGKVAAMAAAEMPLAQAESFFRECRLVGASRSSILRFVGDVSDAWERERTVAERAVRAASDIPAEAASVVVSLDGVMVQMIDSDKAATKAAARAAGRADKGPSGFKEASVGVIAFYDAQGQRLATRRYGRMPESDKVTTKAWLAAEVEDARARRPDLITMGLADGAANNWTFLSTLKLDVELVDFFHTAEHLHRHVSQANGASSVDTQQKLRELRHALLNEPGAAGRVAATLQDLRERAGTAAPSTLKQHGKRQPVYFERHESRLNFLGARELGLPIGSGVTESTCKLTVCDRMRRTGMRWSERGGQAILTLRAWSVSGQFEAGWREASRAMAA